MTHTHVKLPTDDPVLADFLEANGYLAQAQQLRGVEPVLCLWLLTQDEAEGYDTFNACIVAAYDPPWRVHESEWASSPNNVTAECIGVADGVDVGVVLASFNAWTIT